MHTARPALTICLLVALSPLPTMAQAAKDDPANFVSWRSGLASSAQPNAVYLTRARAAGFDMVINLAPPEYDEAVPTEGAILAAQGITYLNIPVRFGNPNAEDFRLFTDVMKSVANKNVLVHCQINLRGSSFVYLYRVITESANEDQARSMLTGVWMPNPTWKKFIEGVLISNAKTVELL